MGNYLAIAQNGYEYHPCTAETKSECGTIGWFPGWPLLLAFFRLLGFDLNTVAKLLPSLLFLGGMVLTERWTRQLNLIPERKRFYLSFLVFYPLSFYFVTAFPYSLIFFLANLYLLVFYSDPNTPRFFKLGLIAFGISLTYPTGVLFLLIPFGYYSFQWMTSKRKTLSSKSSIARSLWPYLQKSALCALPFILGPLIYFIYLGVKFQNPMVYFEFQSHFNRTFGNPFTIIYGALFHAPTTERNFLSWFLVILALGIDRASLRRFPELSFYFFAAFLFSPATGTTEAIFRHSLLWFPLGILIASNQRPRWIQFLILLLSGIMMTAFFVPRFMNGLVI